MGYRLKIKTSYISPVTLKVFPENNYLPIFIVRNISNSKLVGDFSGTSVHFRCLAPSSSLLKHYRDGIIRREEFEKRYIIEMSEVNLIEAIGRLNYLSLSSGAQGVVLMGYGEDDTLCHRSILRDLLNNTGLLYEKVTEILL